MGTRNGPGSGDDSPGRALSLTSSVARSGAPSAGSGGLPAVSALGFYTVLALLLFHRAWAAPARLMVGNSDDNWQTVWFMRWVPYALTHSANPLFTARIDHPTGVNLMWNTSMPLVGVLAWPVMAAYGPVVTYNMVITAAVATSGLAAYILVRRLAAGWFPALLAGTFYAFSAYMAGHSFGHLHLMIVAFPPLVFLLLHEILAVQARGAVAMGAILGALAAAQLLVAAEVLVSTGLVAAAGMAIVVLLHRDQFRSHLRHAAVALGVAAAVALALGAAPLLFAFFGPDRVGGLAYPASLVNDPLAFVVPTSNTILAPAFVAGVAHRFPGNLSEWGAYLGFPLLAIIIVTAYVRRAEPLIRLLVLLIAVVALLSLGRRLHTLGTDLPVPLPWALLGRLPVLSDVPPARFSLQIALLAAIMLSLFVELLLRTRGPARGFGLGAVGITVLSLVPTPPPASPSLAPAFFRSGAVDRIPPGSLVLVAPFAAATPYAIHDEAMLWQATAGMRFTMPEGYALRPGPADGPPDSATQREMMRIALTGRRVVVAPTPAEATAAIAAEWRHWGVNFVVVGPMRHQDSMLALVRAVTGQPGTAVDGVWVWDLRDAPPGDPVTRGGG